MTKQPSRVAKIGGSLLSRPTLIADLRAWLAAQPPSQWQLIVGGGAAIDEVHALQRLHGFDDAAAHWMCIRVMQANAEMLRALLGPPIADEVVDPWEFLLGPDAALGAAALPQTWDVSSDSIAARVTELIAADELVLLKSALPRDALNLADYVDPYFATASAKLRSIRFVNLAERSFPELRYRAGSVPPPS